MNDIRTNASSWLACAVACLCIAAPAHADDDPRYDELSRKLDVVVQELENMRMGAAAETTAYDRRPGKAPAASKVYGVRQGVSIGGYGEMLLEDFDAERENGAPSGAVDQLDFLRQIFYVGYKFSDELLFNSEIEIEHAGTGGSTLQGEVAVEFAYLDWSRDPRLGIRAGMVLVPVGLVNELHEPPIFIGAKRPDVENAIIPTTWRVNGAGIYGEIPSGVQYRAYVSEGLNARNFSASSTIRSGRQKGSKSAVAKPAISGRIDFAGVPGLLFGISGYRGDSWQEAQPDTLSLSPVVTLVDLHALFQHQGFEARGVYVRGTLDDAGALSDALNLTGMQRLGKRFHGYYVEAAFDVLPLAYPGTRYALLPYVRFEELDTQDDVPGGMENPANARTVLTVGAAFKPHPNVVVKGDRQQRRNDADTATSQWNVQVGFLF